MPRPSNPLRNVTGPEVIQIMESESFSTPPSIEETAWDEAVRKVRDAIEKLGKKIDFKLGTTERPPHIWHDVCVPASKMVREASDIDDALLKDPVVQKVRDEIGLRLIVRMRLASHDQFQPLVDFIKGKNGTLSPGDIWDKKKLHNLAAALNRLINEFGDTKERKMLGWQLVSEFLSEQTGMDVTFTNIKITTRNRRDDGDSEPKAADLSPNEISDPRIGKTMNVVESAHERLIAKIEKALKELVELEATMKGDLEELRKGKATIASEHAPDSAKAAAFERERQNIETTYDGLLEALRKTAKLSGEDPVTVELPARQASAKRRSLKALKKRYEPILRESGKKGKETVRIDRKIELIGSSFRQLEATRKQLALALMRVRGIFEQQAPNASAVAATPRTPSASPPPGRAEGTPNGQLVKINSPKELIKKLGDGKAFVIKVTAYNKVMVSMLLGVQRDNVVVDSVVPVTVRRQHGGFLLDPGNKFQKTWLIPDGDKSKFDTANLHVLAQT